MLTIGLLSLPQQCWDPQQCSSVAKQHVVEPHLDLQILFGERVFIVLNLRCATKGFLFIHLCYDWTTVL